MGGMLVHIKIGRRLERYAVLSKLGEQRMSKGSAIQAQSPLAVKTGGTRDWEISNIHIIPDCETPPTLTRHTVRGGFPRRGSSTPPHQVPRPWCRSACPFPVGPGPLRCRAAEIVCSAVRVGYFLALTARHWPHAPCVGPQTSLT